MSLERVATLLRETSGLEADALGARALEEAVRRRAALAGRDVAGYAGSLAADADERERLIAELLVHETSFFRYPASFEHLAAHARARALARPGPVRILSAACATGQEAWSIAIALLEGGVPPERIAIDAFDRSGAAIETARQGRYERGGTRGLDPARAARWCTSETGALTMRPEVTRLVRFERGDLLSADAPFAGGVYDAVLCRNLLIYLTEAARRRALEVLGVRLAPDGRLYLGHAEVLVARAEGFVPDGDAGAYACVRSAARTAQRPPPTAAPRPPAPPSAPPRPPPPPAASLAQVPDSPPPQAPRTLASTEPAPAADDAVRAARALADAGRLDAACALLEAETARGARSADVYHLLAVVRRAAGRDREADEALARALYLDPSHAEALLLAAVSAEGRGERGVAARLHARARAAAHGRA